MTFASAVLEAIDALLALAYIGLQIYYGVCYHIQVFKFVCQYTCAFACIHCNHMAAALSGKAQSHSSGAVCGQYQKVFTQAFDVCKACFYCGAFSAMRV